MPNRHLILICCSLLALLACNRVKEVILPHTELIFPQDSGKTRTYYVIDSSFNTAGRTQPIVDAYTKKEVLGNTEEDLLGRSVQVIDMYRGPWPTDPDEDFIYSHRATQYIDPVENSDYFAERREDNIRVQVLKFPVFEDISWNGNLFNNLGAKPFRYLAVDSTVSIQGKTYENCVVVINQEFTESIIDTAYAYEIYAPEIGLIKKFNRRLLWDGPNRNFNPDKSRITIEEILEHN
ncbi:MAG: hypothetical protein AAFV07_11700 [Bacteroidota bacterium]